MEYCFFDFYVDDEDKFHKDDFCRSHSDCPFFVENDDQLDSAYDFFDGLQKNNYKRFIK